MLSRPDLLAQENLDAFLSDEQLHCFRRRPLEEQVTLNFIRPTGALQPARGGASGGCRRNLLQRDRLPPRDAASADA